MEEARSSWVPKHLSYIPHAPYKDNVATESCACFTHCPGVIFEVIFVQSPSANPPFLSLPPKQTDLRCYSPSLSDYGLSMSWAKREKLFHYVKEGIQRALVCFIIGTNASTKGHRSVKVD